MLVSADFVRNNADTINKSIETVIKLLVEKPWQVCHQATCAGTSLQKHNKIFDGDAANSLPDSEAKIIRLDIANAKNVLENLGKLECEDEAGKTLVEDIKVALQLFHDKFKQQDDTTLKHKETTAKQKLLDEMESIKMIAYGGKTPGQVWSLKVKAKADIKDVILAAEQQGLLSIDDGELLEQLGALAATKNIYYSASGNSGAVVDQDTMEKAEALHIRGWTTWAEKKLVLLAQKPDPKAQNKVREIIMEMRKKVGKHLKDKDLLTTALYKWSYGVLMNQEG